MTTITHRKAWPLNNQEARMKKGPLISVRHPDGHYTKMYREDAIAAGLLPGVKSAPLPGNKIAPLPGNKSTPEVEAPPDDFTTIPGVGLASSRSLVAQGVKTFDQLRGTDLSTLSLSKRVVDAIEAWRA